MRRYHIDIRGRTHVVDVQEVTAQRFKVIVEGRELDVVLSAAEDVSEAIASPEIAPTRQAATTTAAPLSAARFKPPAPETLPPMVHADPPPLPTSPPTVADRSSITAPMPGTITSVRVVPGDAVTTGQVLLTLEAMKMVNAIRAPHDATVAEVKVEAGQSVGYGQVLLTFKEA